MQLLIRGAYFVGDPASSFSRNIGYVRKLSLEGRGAMNLKSNGCLAKGLFNHTWE